ncbi:MAG: hypothetical protein RIR95_622, partial [Pseudomonadota bacterium]
APRKPRSRRYKIQEVVKVRQIMLVQVVKEERGNKGAALTTYLSLAGRYCVLMPNTARGGGISRKITQAADRKKLKEIANEIEVPEGAGLIIRTAGAKRTKPEIKRDYEYLMRLWEQVRELTLKSIAPAPIYEEGDLIKRSIRDLYNREIDEVLVEGLAGYRTAKDFMRMIMPNHAKDVIRYDEPMPLFARYQVESYLSGMFNPTVQLKSGGYIVIGVTEALVAIDVNSGRATKEGSIEETALKTNLEAAEEVARQLRLRDLAGLIVIDFIDMEERRNNASVEKRLKDKLKTDRARIQVGRISGFGLMEMSRQRLRPGMLESTTQPCPHCHGTGLIRSDDSLGLTILRALEEEGTRKRSKEVLLKAPIEIVNFLFNQKREHIAIIETRYGMAVRIEADPTLISPNFSIEKFKTALRVVPDPSLVISGHAGLMGEAVDEEDDIIDEIDDAEEIEGVEAAEENGEGVSHAAGNGQSGTGQPGTGPKKKRRRRRKKKSGGYGEAGSDQETATSQGDDESGDDSDSGDDTDSSTDGANDAENNVAVSADQAPASPEMAAEAAPSKSRSSRSRSSKAKTEALVEAAPKAEAKPKAASSRSRAAKPVADEAAAADVDVLETTEGAKAAPKRTRTRSTKPKAAGSAAATVVSAPAASVSVAVPVVAVPVVEAPVMQPVAIIAAPEPASAPVPAPQVVAQVVTAPVEPKPDGPKKKGWWSLGR